MIRDTDRRAVARGQLGRGAGLRRRPAAGAARQARARRPSASSPRRAAPTRKPSWCRSWPAPSSATTTPTPAPGSAIRPPATGWARPSAPRPAPRISTRVEHTDVVIVIGANPTDGHPVFACRLKKRLRPGRQADRHRPAPDRPREDPRISGRPSPGAEARHQRRRADRAGACDRDREACSTKPSSASAATGMSSRTTPNSSRTRATAPRRPRPPPASRRPSCAPRRDCSPPAATARSTTGSA